MAKKDKQDEEQGVLSRDDMQAVGIVEESQHTNREAEEGVLHDEEQQAKLDLSGGIHDTSTSFGKVVSDNETDAAGNSPSDLPEVGEGDTGVLNKEEGQQGVLGNRQDKSSKSSKTDKKADKSKSSKSSNS